jgi:alpha-methylacyl-CoA racemase
VPNHPQVQANRTFAHTEHPVAGPLIEPRPPVRFAGRALDPSGPAATMGAHTDEVLRGAGYGDDEIAELRRADVVA